MTRKTTPPKFAESLIGFFAGPDLEDEICGDLLEYYNSGKSKRWYWSQVLRSIPQLCLVQCRQMTQGTLLRETLFLSLAFTFLCLWEINIARENSWPIAQNILSYSPLSPANSCKAIYVLIYGLAVFMSMVTFTSWAKAKDRTKHFKKAHIVFIGLLASTIPLFLFLNPGPFDGSRDFRVYQSILIWGITLLFLVQPHLRMKAYEHA